MNSVVVLLLLITIVNCAPQLAKNTPIILKYENDILPPGGYNFAYETSDGISRQETAEMKNAGMKDELLSVKGSYSWVDAEGKKYVVNYIADENGFHPEGEHIPL